MAADVSNSASEAAGFDALKQRLDEIITEVERDDISLDDALSLYEEAVNIGIAACDASELDIPQEPADTEAEKGAADNTTSGAAPADAAPAQGEGAPEATAEAAAETAAADQPA